VCLLIVEGELFEYFLVRLIGYFSSDKTRKANARRSNGFGISSENLVE